MREKEGGSWLHATQRKVLKKWPYTQILGKWATYVVALVSSEKLQSLEQTHANLSFSGMDQVSQCFIVFKSNIMQSFVFDFCQKKQAIAGMVIPGYGGG